MAPCRLRILAGFAGLAAAGCTQVSVLGADGTVTTERGFGVIRIDTQPGRLPQIVRLEGLGLVSQNGAMTLGYASAEYAILPTGGCRIVVWLDKETVPPAFLDDLAGKDETLCLAGPGVHSQGENK